MKQLLDKWWTEVFSIAVLRGAVMFVIILLIALLIKLAA